MQKIHLLLKKEELNEEKIESGKKIAVVLDVLLATTTITSALHNGAKEVIPVMNSEEALEVAKAIPANDCVIAGEYEAKPIDGFVYPSPTLISKMIKDKTLILSTTNGTVALRKSAGATKVFIAALVNNPYVAKAIQKEKEAETIVVVCSGNSTGFSLEDFYGAGHFIQCLVGNQREEYELTDSALAALMFYQGRVEASKQTLADSFVGRMFTRHEGEEDLQLAAEKGAIDLVPILKDGKVVCSGKGIEVKTNN
ncbi:2-phosphosulfolactate phosphatase [Mesobacillus maritimus]|uniref:Probable 2-phosphosulfolactate phosphatase n=1 Tax=Mesobacillus maritimus TaxID=1643336 RepID=A0ABS7K8Q9_9BACI|nr:2-phosphosulfolactate phosphatase [Mesobacillus maritimus]MBY0098651.1 2-phosphosulfolactate phosphatase [Mesobacillus maritimus]